MKEALPRLTIAIPTYNRNEILLGNLKHLMPQLTQDCKLLLLDNCSDVPVSETLGELFAQYPQVNYEIRRHEVNIGANANITRCLEVCASEWMWLIGDDDRPQPNAIETIFRHIEAHPDAVYINFSYDGIRSRTYTTRGLDEFVRKFDYSANLPWISSSVRRVSIMRPNVRFGYQYSYSLMPHVAILLTSIGENGVCCLSHEPVIKIERNEVPIEEQWSSVNLALGYPVLLDLPLKPRTRERLARKLLMTNAGHSLNLRWLLHQLMLMAVQQGDPRSTLYIYDQILRRGADFGTHRKDRFKQKLKLLAGRFFLRFPRLTAGFYKKLSHQDLGDWKSQDRFKRM